LDKIEIKSQDQRLQNLTPKNRQRKSKTIRCLSSQHLGRSEGGGGNFWLRRFPSWTIHAIFKPQLVCTSRWQCMNQTPVQQIMLQKLTMKWNCTENPEYGSLKIDFMLNWYSFLIDSLIFSHWFINII